MNNQDRSNNFKWFVKKTTVFHFSEQQHRSRKILFVLKTDANLYSNMRGLPSGFNCFRLIINPEEAAAVCCSIG